MNGLPTGHVTVTVRRKLYRSSLIIRMEGNGENSSMLLISHDVAWTQTNHDYCGKKKILLWSVPNITSLVD